MTARIATATLVVPDYDAAIRFYCGALGFELLEDTQLSESKRWVRVAPAGGGAALLLAKADGHAQEQAVGNQTGGRVSFFLETDGFDRDYTAFAAAGVEFLEEPRVEPYAKVAVFHDPFGNKWDLLEPLNRSE
jgi:catechol 2,3-dioxygenase-like lactoylglutathione lyase family enzyme